MTWNVLTEYNTCLEFACSVKFHLLADKYYQSVFFGETPDTALYLHRKQIKNESK